MQSQETTRGTTNKAASIIHNSITACLKNEATFPEHVKTIAEVDVLIYKVDLLKYSATYKLKDQSTHIEQLPNLNMQANTIFCKESVKEAIKEVQKRNIDYLTFLKKIIVAGTFFYEVNITEKHVTYIGANQGSHIKLFPADPANAAEQTIIGLTPK